MARGRGYVIGLEAGQAAIRITPGEKTNPVVSLEFAGARPSRAVVGPELPGKVNYILGSDPRKWQIGLATYARVTYPNAYPGIDVVYYGNRQQLEFDLVVKPGADPEAIRLKVAGAGKLSVDGSGALDLGEAAGGLRVALPEIYQVVNGAKKRVPGRYAIVGGDEVEFQVDPFDRTRPLVIDPAIVYSTLLGGNSLSSQGSAMSQGQGIALDGTQEDGFVSEINAAGTAFLYSTYYGGSGADRFQAIAVDSTGAAWVAGYTSSTDFPVVSPVQPTSGGGTDAVVVKLNPSGVPVFSTYLGGSSTDEANGVAVDSSRNAYVTGYTSGAFPATSGIFQSSNNGSSNVFVAKFNSTGSELYATLLGGTGSDMGQAIAADAGGNAYVTGSSSSASIPNAPTGGRTPMCRRRAGKRQS